jgi:hypothetical protein
MNQLQSKLKELNQMLIDDGYNGSNIVIQTLEEIREAKINYTRCCETFYCWDEQALGKDRRCQEECDTCASVRKEK